MMLHVRPVPERNEEKSWVEGMLDGTLFEGMIVECAPKVSKMSHID